MTTAIHRKGLAYCLMHDSRTVARARARFRFDRAMTNKVRSRLHDKNTSKDCTHPLCVEQSRRMDEQMALLLDEDENVDRETLHIEHNGRHVLLECPLYEDKREQTIQDLGLLDQKCHYRWSYY